MWLLTGQWQAQLECCVPAVGWREPLLWWAARRLRSLLLVQFRELHHDWNYGCVLGLLPCGCWAFWGWRMCVGGHELHDLIWPSLISLHIKLQNFLRWYCNFDSSKRWQVLFLIHLNSRSSLISLRAICSKLSSPCVSVTWSRVTSDLFEQVLELDQKYHLLFLGQLSTPGHFHDLTVPLRLPVTWPHHAEAVLNDCFLLS